MATTYTNNIESGKTTAEIRQIVDAAYAGVPTQPTESQKRQIEERTKAAFNEKAKKCKRPSNLSLLWACIRRCGKRFYNYFFG